METYAIVLDPLGQVGGSAAYEPSGDMLTNMTAEALRSSHPSAVIAKRIRRLWPSACHMFSLQLVS